MISWDIIWLNQFSTLSHSVYVLRTRHKKGKKAVQIGQITWQCFILSKKGYTCEGYSAGFGKTQDFFTGYGIWPPRGSGNHQNLGTGCSIGKESGILNDRNWGCGIFEKKKRECGIRTSLPDLNYPSTGIFCRSFISDNSLNWSLINTLSLPKDTLQLLLDYESYYCYLLGNGLLKATVKRTFSWNQHFVIKCS